MQIFDTIDEIVKVAAAEGIDADIAKDGEIAIATNPAQLGRLRAELDGAATWYGNWVFFEHLSLLHGPGIVPAIWHATRSTRVPSIRAIEAALLDRGSNLGDALSRFAGSGDMLRVR